MVIKSVYEVRGRLVVAVDREEGRRVSSGDLFYLNNGVTWVVVTGIESLHPRGEVALSLRGVKKNQIAVGDTLVPDRDADLHRRGRQ